MQLALEAPIFCREDKIPVTACAAIVDPMRNRWIVAKDSVQRDISLVLITEIFRPSVDFLLAGRVPWHFAAEGVGFFFPAIGAGSHSGFEIIGLLLHAFEFQIGENLKKNVAFHLSEYREVLRIIRHRD